MTIRLSPAGVIYLTYLPKSMDIDIFPSSTSVVEVGACEALDLDLEGEVILIGGVGIA